MTLNTQTKSDYGVLLLLANMDSTFKGHKQQPFTAEDAYADFQIPFCLIYNGFQNGLDDLKVILERNANSLVPSDVRHDNVILTKLKDGRYIIKNASWKEVCSYIPNAQEIFDKYCPNPEPVKSFWQKLFQRCL